MNATSKGPGRATSPRRLPFHGTFQRELEVAIEAALAAGREILPIYAGVGFGQYAKRDGSPVTDADLAADRVIRAVIQRAFPDDSLLTEEGQDDLTRVQARRCWIVDPIDGTEQFIRRTGEFDVLVAFIEDGRPVAVAGFQPTTSMLIIAEKDQGAWVSINDGEYKRVSFPDPAIPLRVASSKWFGAPENAHLIRPIIAKLGRTVILEVSEIGFSPRMFLSPRKADALIGIRVGSNQDMASEWDFAVTDLVINEAGGVVSDLSGQSFTYNKPTPSNYGGLLASVSPTVHESLLSAIKSTSSAT